jgi:hypothetical protein
MRKNNIGFILFLLLAGCSKSNAPKSLISQWESKYKAESVTERKLASGPAGRCLQDTFTIETLRSEIKQIERTYAGGNPVKGSWKHLNLEKLPIPQANFLKTYGKDLGDLNNPNAIDYAGCEDVPCIYNRIYGKGDHVAGYVHYLWYLRFGHMLSADNHVPDQVSKIAGEYGGKKFPLSSYLYSDPELYGLWRLSLMLKTPHTTLRKLKQVQRIPRGERFEQSHFAGACGVAYSGGWIQMSDSCLKINDNRDLGYLYAAMTHELSHQVDFEEGSRLYKSSYRSQQADYLQLSGFFLEEYKNEDGEQVRQWKLRQGAKLVTSYAGTSPQESFAESLAYFRIDGDHALKQISSEHFHFVSKDYYQNRKFDRDSLIDSWINHYSQNTGREIFKSVVDCSNTPEMQTSSYFKANEFRTPVLPGMLNCLGKSAEDIADNLRARISAEQPEGCRLFASSMNATAWSQAIKTHLSAGFARYIQELNRDKEYLARIKLYLEQLGDKSLAQEAYLDCYNSPDEVACFESGIRDRALTRARSLNLPDDQTNEMADMYVSYHPYAEIKRETTRFYQTVINSNLERVRELGGDLWKSCRQLTHNDDETPTGSNFSLSDGYLISSFYNCVNSLYPNVVKDIVRSINIDGAVVQHPREEVLLFQEVKPFLSTVLREFYLSDREKEARTAKNLIEQDTGKVRSQIVADFSWVKNVIDAAQIEKDCRAQAVGLFPLRPLYHTKRELFATYAESFSCLGIASSSEFNRWLESSKSVFDQKIKDGLEEKILHLAGTKARECLVQFPADSNLNRIRWKVQREECLTSAWPFMEQKVISEAEQDPMVKRFQIDRGALQVTLESSRRRLQIKIFKDYFN